MPAEWSRWIPDHPARHKNPTSPCIPGRWPTRPIPDCRVFVVSYLNIPLPQTTKLTDQRIERTTPPSTRKAAPFVAEESGLATNVTIAATSSVVAKRFNSELGRTDLKNSFSTLA